MCLDAWVAPKPDLWKLKKGLEAVLLETLEPCIFVELGLYKHVAHLSVLLTHATVSSLPPQETRRGEKAAGEGAYLLTPGQLLASISLCSDHHAPREI